MTTDPRHAFVATIRAINRERAMDDYRRDSLIVAVARDIVAERAAAFEAHEFFEPNEPLTGEELTR